MEGTPSQQRGAMSSNQSRKRKGIDGNLCAVKQNSTNHVVGIDNLSDDLLIKVLSCISFKEAARTSVLARRWKSLWNFVFGTLQFDYSNPVRYADDDDDDDYNFYAWEKFVGWVNRVLELHQGGHIEGMVFSVDGKIPMECRAVDGWVYSAVQKEVERFELHLSNEYPFPSLEMLVSHSPSPFRCLRILRLVALDIEDEVVNYFLASCLNLQHFSIVRCWGLYNVLVVDPPSLRVLEISRCNGIKSLELSADSLVSLAYGGIDRSINGLLLKKIPNIHELTIIDELFVSFFSKPEIHSSYIDQLVKLVVDIHLSSRIPPLVAPPDLPQLRSLKELEVKVYTEVGRCLLFFTLLIKASPQLCKFRIEMETEPSTFNLGLSNFLFPAISGDVKFKHRRLKVVEMGGYIGCSSDEELLRSLVKNAPLIGRVVIDTQSEYYDNPTLAMELRYLRENPDYREYFDMGEPTRDQSRHHAQRLVSTLPQRIQFIVT